MLPRSPQHIVLAGPMLSQRIVRVENHPPSINVILPGSVKACHLGQRKLQRLAASWLSLEGIRKFVPWAFAQFVQDANPGSSPRDPWFIHDSSWIHGMYCPIPSSKAPKLHRLLHIFSVSHSAEGLAVWAVPPPSAMRSKRLAKWDAIWCNHGALSSQRIPLHLVQSHFFHLPRNQTRHMKPRVSIDKHARPGFSSKLMSSSTC